MIQDLTADTATSMSVITSKSVDLVGECSLRVEDYGLHTIAWSYKA